MPISKAEYVGHPWLAPKSDQLDLGPSFPAPLLSQCPRSSNDSPERVGTSNVGSAARVGAVKIDRTTRGPKRSFSSPTPPDRTSGRPWTTPVLDILQRSARATPLGRPPNPPLVGGRASGHRLVPSTALTSGASDHVYGFGVNSTLESKSTPARANSGRNRQHFAHSGPDLAAIGARSAELVQSWPSGWPTSVHC